MLLAEIAHKGGGSCMGAENIPRILSLRRRPVCPCVYSATGPAA